MAGSDLARYPFLNEAGEYLRESSFGWEELDRPDMKYIIDRAAERIEMEVDGKIYDNLERYEIEILTFLISLVIIKSIGIDQVLRKFALAEARRAEKFLTEDLRKQSEIKRRSVFTKIFEDLFKLKIVISEDRRLFKVRVVDYLARASHFHEQEWKLINRLVHNGYVYLDADETVRLIRSELSVLIYSRSKTMTLSNLPDSIKAKVLGIAPKFGRDYYRANIQTISGYPPCVKHAIDEMSKGENLSHSARILLATYMLSIGKNIDEIASLFHTAPDYDEKVTRYQIEHLAGKKGSGTKYFVPSCEKVINENLCFATKEWAGIVNPFQFGRGLRKKVE